MSCCRGIFGAPDPLARGGEALVVSGSLGLALFDPGTHCLSWVLLPRGRWDRHARSERCRADVALLAEGAIPRAVSLLRPQVEKLGWDSWSRPVPTSFPKLPP